MTNATYQSAADCPLGEAHGIASTHGNANDETCCDFCGFPVAEVTRHRTQALADAAAEAEPVGYIIAEMLNRKSEFERNGIVMTASPQGMSTLPLYAARPVQSELVEALEGLLKYEGHHVYCGHAPDYDQPCVCGFNEADAKARALVAKATGDGL